MNERNAPIYDEADDPNVINEEQAGLPAPVDDDRDDDARDQGSERRNEADRKPTDQEPQRSAVHDKRNEIYRRKSEERAAERDENEDEAQALIWPAAHRPKAETPAGGDDDEPGTNADPAPAQPTQAKRKIKVYGEEREISDDELVEAAQKYYASDRKLEDVKAMANRLSALEQQLSERREKSDDQATDEEREAQTRADDERRERRRKAIEKIQLGDVEEGAEALEELLAEHRQSEEDLDRRISERVRQEREAERAQERAEQTRQRELANYAEKYPEIAADRGWHIVTATAIHDAIVGELRSIGVQDSDLVHAVQDPAVARRWHQELRDQGHQLSEPTQLIHRASDSVIQRYNLRSAQPAAQEDTPPQKQPTQRETRREEKRNLMQEPRTVTTARDRRQPAAPKSRDDAIAEMRARRGQAV